MWCGAYVGCSAEGAATRQPVKQPGDLHCGWVSGPREGGYRDQHGPQVRLPLAAAIHTKRHCARLVLDSLTVVYARAGWSTVGASGGEAVRPSASS